MLLNGSKKDCYELNKARKKGIKPKQNPETHSVKDSSTNVKLILIARINGSSESCRKGKITTVIIDRRYQEATTQNIIDRKKVEKVFEESKGRIYVRSYFFKSCNTFELKMSGPLGY